MLGLQRAYAHELILSWLYHRPKHTLSPPPLLGTLPQQQRMQSVTWGSLGQLWFTAVGDKVSVCLCLCGEGSKFKLWGLVTTKCMSSFCPHKMMLKSQVEPFFKPVERPYSPCTPPIYIYNQIYTHIVLHMYDHTKPHMIVRTYVLKKAWPLIHMTTRHTDL